MVQISKAKLLELAREAIKFDFDQRLPLDHIEKYPDDVEIHVIEVMRIRRWQYDDTDEWKAQFKNDPETWRHRISLRGRVVYLDVARESMRWEPAQAYVDVYGWGTSDLPDPRDSQSTDS